MNLLRASPGARATEITPNVSPLVSEPKEHDMQEKKAAPKGEEAPTLAELLEGQKVLSALMNQLQKERTPVRTAKLFSEATMKCSGQLKPDLLLLNFFSEKAPSKTFFLGFCWVTLRGLLKTIKY